MFVMPYGIFRRAKASPRNFFVICAALFYGRHRKRRVCALIRRASARDAVYYRQVFFIYRKRLKKDILLLVAVYAKNRQKEMRREKWEIFGYAS